MHTDEFLIEKTKKLFEINTGWGDSNEWTNQDFVILSEKIQEKTNVALSHVTLKRVWGKVKYESLPNTHTLDTLVQFLGYENWRSFKSQNGNGAAHPQNITEAPAAITIAAEETQPAGRKNSATVKFVLFGLCIVALIVSVFSVKKKPPVINTHDYKFSSKTVVTAGLPNSVIFNYDAAKSPYDSVVIQQS